MKFSVLMSVYYKENPEFLDKALESVLVNQTLLPDELVLVEDGPLTEELHGVINKYKKNNQVIILKLEENQGLGRALSAGMDLCRNEWVARMDSDDISHQNRFELQIETIKSRSGVAVVGSWVDEFDSETGNIISTRKVPENHDAIKTYAIRRCPVNHPSVFFNRKAVMDSGGYRHFKMFEDYYLWGRMLMKGYEFYNIPRSLLDFRTTRQTMKRRGGWNYMVNDIKLQYRFKNIRLINNYEFISNVFIRAFFRLSPVRLRGWLYATILR